MSRKRRDEELAFAAVDGRATESQRQELERRLAEDPALRRTFELQRRLVAEIRGLESEAPPFDLVGAALRRSSHAERSPRRALGLGLRLAAAAAVVVGVVAAVLVWREPVAVEPPGVPPMIATSVQGTVWLDVSGVRRRAASGDTIEPGTRLESAPDGSITLARAETVRVTIYEDTALELTAGDGASARWRLSRGVLKAESEVADAPVTIGIAGLSDAVHVRQADAGVLAGGDGGFVVACTRGRVEVSRASELVEVVAGKQLVADRRGGASLREQPPVLALEVAPVGPVPAGTGEVELSGRSAPGVILTIDGERVEVAADGSFVHRVRFDGTAREVVARARDVLARRRESLVALAPARPPRQPRFRKIETEWQWEGRDERG